MSNVLMTPSSVVEKIKQVFSEAHKLKAMSRTEDLN